MYITIEEYRDLVSIINRIESDVLGRYEYKSLSNMEQDAFSMFETTQANNAIKAMKPYVTKDIIRVNIVNNRIWITVRIGGYT